MQRSYCALTCFSRDGLFSFGNLDYVMLVYILETIHLCHLESNYVILLKSYG